MQAIIDWCLETNMNQLQTKADLLAVSLSILCLLHCFLLPLFVIAMPSIGALFFTNEAFHLWMVVAVIPISGIALYGGWKAHKILKVTILGIIGLIILISSALLGHDILTERWEQSFTILGTLIITCSHLCNYFFWKVEWVNKNDDSRTF